ncbi:MAG TPA: hypothetical protein VET66_14680 [Steroidobacteraceae bacterium]|nr:hypothetical protein [Steroidobacteraceae bacterium]
MPGPSPTPGAPPPPPVTRLRDTYVAQPRVRRGLIIYGAALLFGLLVMPFLIWFGGSRVLGPYTHGQNTHAGPFALLGDYWVGLAHGSAVFWAVALGPVLLLGLARLFTRLFQALP